jgi:hypothetical protein
MSLIPNASQFHSAPGQQVFPIQRKNTAGMTTVARDGYEKGYICGFNRGDWERHTTGGHVFHPETPRTPQQCGLPPFRWIVVEYGGRNYNVDRTEQAYPEWIKSFSDGYLDGWYDGRKVARPEYVWGTGAMPPPPDDGAESAQVFTPIWVDEDSGVTVMQPIQMKPGKAGETWPDMGGSPSGQDAKPPSDRTAMYVGLGAVALLGVVGWWAVTRES